MATKVEIFSAGCPLCSPLVDLVRSIADDSCEVSVLDTQDPAIAERAKSLGVRTVPAVAVNGKLAACCTTGGYDEATIRGAMLGG